jgi:hypothetical protein
MPVKDLQTKTSDREQKPILSLILCSRNDEYMGNSRWRLRTALNYLAKNVQELNKENLVEVLVADWGSEVPLAEVLQLTPEAARLTSFVLIPAGLANQLQGDSAFPEVLALNAVARRARGEYLGRIDQDTLVGKRFLSFFFDLYEDKRTLALPLDSALLFANRRDIPYRFSVRCPPLASVEMMIAIFGSALKVWTLPDRPFWTYWVGIWLIHRDLWNECGGYDETLIHYNWMETDMIVRLKQKYEVVNLGQLVDFDFYHLEHYHPHVAWVARNHPKKNQSVNLKDAPRSFHPNGTDWGLNQFDLAVSFAQVSDQENKGTGVAFILLLALTSMQITYDKVFLAWMGAFAVFSRRAALVRKTVSGHSIVRWPGLLMKVWIGKRSDRVLRQKELS